MKTDTVSPVAIVAGIAFIISMFVWMNYCFTRIFPAIKFKLERRWRVTIEDQAGYATPDGTWGIDEPGHFWQSVKLGFVQLGGVIFIMLLPIFGVLGLMILVLSLLGIH